MNKCLECGNETNNQKFCGMSCAAKFNNKKFPRRKKEGMCKVCGCSISTSRKYCKACYVCFTPTGLFAKQAEQNGRFYPTIGGGNPGSKAVRRYCIEKYGNKCSICGLDAISWNGQPLVLIVDHIDGHSNNWALNNIRLVCPNCDTQLPTFKARNKGNSTRKYTIMQK